MTNVAAERDAFEAWYAKRHPKPTHENSTWAHCAKMDDWEVWQARAGAAPAAVAGPGPAAAPAAPAVDAQPLIARSIAEWHEDDGDVSWWAWCGHGWAGEPAWIGRPTDDGWPGYHTHWTAHPAMPPAIAAQAAAKGA